MLSRVLLVSNIPTPYRVPLLNEIDRQLKEKDIKFKVVFAASGYARRKFVLDPADLKFNHTYLESTKVALGDVEKTVFSYSGLGKEIRKYNPDKIIVSGFSMATVKIWLRSFVRKTEYIIWSGSIESPGRYDSTLRKLQRRMVVSRASSFVAYGSKAKEYLVKLGADPEKVHIGINTVDTTFFSEETNKLRMSAKPDKARFIYVGYLVPRKNVSKLIELMAELRKTRDDFVLDILGDGSDKAALENLVRNKNLGEHVVFHGFVQKEKLPEYFAQSSCFLFQTDFDIWGLVLNEAMAAGLPVLSSLNAGATSDLISDGQTGFAVDYNNTQQVLNRLNDLLDHPGQYRDIGKKAATHIQEKASIFASAAGFVDSLLGKKAAR